MGENESKNPKTQEIRTRHGVRLGDLVKRGNRPTLHIKVGRNEDFVSPEEFVEAVVGLPVERIVYRKKTTSIDAPATPAPISALPVVSPT